MAFKMKGFSGFKHIKGDKHNEIHGPGHKDHSRSRKVSINPMTEKEKSAFKKDGILKEAKERQDLVDVTKEKRRKSKAKYTAGQGKRLSLKNPEHDASNREEYDMALERLINDHDVDENMVPQVGAAAYYKKLKKLEDKAEKFGW